jgi:uncharacterized NAD(P)/FAD-binding protein YdhS
MDTAPGRLAWLTLTPDELRYLDVAAVVGAALGGDESLFASLGTKVSAQSRNRFGAVRLTHAEIQALGPAFKAVMDELRAWGGEPRSATVATAIRERFDSPERPLDAAILAQKVQAFRVKIGLQKGWTKSGGIPAED